MAEKGLPDLYHSSVVVGSAPETSIFKRRFRFVVVVVAFCNFFFWIPLLWVSGGYGIPFLGIGEGILIKSSPSSPSSLCQQVAPLFPAVKSKELADMDVYIASAEFRNESIQRLGGAVRIPTQSYDDMGVIGVDKRWDIFYDMERFLEQQFPGVHGQLRKEVVNEHGLVFTWAGSEGALKPLLLMAHQDVVPVPGDTVGSWTFPPFGGVFDGRFVWGRGASDCKNSLVGILEAVEELVKAGFRPRRTVVLSFGFDEEISGMEGAGHLAPFLLDRFGKDGVAAIVDEGAGINTLFGTHFATPGVAEKGEISLL